MQFDLRMPTTGYWEAGSRKSAHWIAKTIHQVMNRVGVKVESHYVSFLENRNIIGYDAKLIIGQSVSVRFSDDEAGSTLKISLFGEDDTQVVFLRIWQNLINAGYVFDEYFKKEIKPEDNSDTKQPGETGQKATQDQERFIKALDAIPDKYRRFSPQLMKYAVNALEKSRKSPALFVNVSISNLAQLLEDERNQVIETFKQECPDLPEEFNPDYVGLDLYCNADTLRDWVKKYGKPKRRKSQK